MNTKECRVKKVSFRLTETEAKKLEKAAQFLGCRPSDAIRMGLTSVSIAAAELAAAE